MLTYSSAMAYIFKSYGIKYYFWSHIFNFNYFNRKVNDFMQKNQSWIKVLGEYDRIGNHDPHPSVTGHKEIAEQILNFVK